VKTILTKWELWSYDIWGNKQDGFWVNDRSCFDREYPIRLKVVVNNPGTEREFLSATPSDYQIQRAFGVRCKIQESVGDDTHICPERASDGYMLGEMFCVSHESLSPIREAKE